MRLELNDDSQVSYKVTWILSFADFGVDHGTHPTAVPPGVFSLCVGVDGRLDGSLHRHPGMRTWAELQTHSTLRNVYYTEAAVPNKFGPQQYGFMDMAPFSIRKKGGTGHVFGVVLYRMPGDFTIPSAYVVYKDSENDVDIPVSSQVTAGGFSVSALTAKQAEQGLRTLSQPVQAVSVGRFLYTTQASPILIPAPPDGGQYPGGGLVSWYDPNDVYVQNSVWGRDYFGIPTTEALCTDKTTVGSGGSDGLSLVGQYKLAFRLVDTFRNRRSNMGWRSIRNTITRETAVAASAPIVTVAAANEAVWIEGWQEVAGKAVGAGNYNVAGSGRKRWDRWETFTTLSTLDVDEVAGGPFISHDIMPVRSDWQTNADDLVGRMAMFVDQDRQETPVLYGPTPLARQLTPTTDRGIAAGSIPFDPLLDECYDWNEIADMRALAFYQGLMVGLCNLSPKSRSNTGANTSNDQSRGNLSLIWSDERGLRPENFPIVNVFNTDYATPVYGDLTTSPGQYLDTLDRSPVALVNIAGALYSFGDGTIYRLTRTDFGVNVEEVARSFPLLNRNAVCSFGQGAVFATPSGFFMLDGGTGSVTPLRGLARLLRDRWPTVAHQDWVQLAYDSAMDAVYILCGSTGDLVTMWMATNRITMDSTNFSLLRQGRLPTRVKQTGRGSGDERAMFLSWFGKLCIPEPYDTTQETGLYTMHGLRPYPGVSNPLQHTTVRVTAQTTTTWTTQAESLTLTQLTLSYDLTGATTTPIAVNPWILDGISVQFLTGPLAGLMYQTHIHPSQTGTTATINLWANLTGVNLQGSIISLSPIPMRLVGGPLPGTKGTRFLQRKHIDTTLPLLTRILLPSAYTRHQSYASVIRSGACETSALLATEPAVRLSQAEVIARRGSYPRMSMGAPLNEWVNLTEGSVHLANNPTSPSQVDLVLPYTNYGAIKTGDNIASTWTSPAPLPLLVVDGGGFSPELLEWYIDGEVTPSTKAR